MEKRVARQVSFDQRHRHHVGHGGYRKGAGRKSTRTDGRSCDPKKRRRCFRGRRPVMVTLRACSGVPNLRQAPLMKRLRKAMLLLKHARKDFRVVHYSIQSDHVHMIVEADDNEALGRGMQAFGIRMAKAVHKIFGTRGKVLETGYHADFLRCGRQAWNGLRYVLLNYRKHTRGRGKPQLDYFSSMHCLDGLRGPPLEASWETGEQEVSKPSTSTLLEAFRRFGPIDPSDVPGRPFSQARV